MESVTYLAEKDFRASRAFQTLSQDPLYSSGFVNKSNSLESSYDEYGGGNGASSRGTRFEHALVLVLEGQYRTTGHCIF